MKLIVQNGEPLIVSQLIFRKNFNEALIHQLVVSYKNCARRGTHSQKTRSEVSGGGAKPWRQKGTGRARAGTNRSPIWRSGGVTFASKYTLYKNKINKKMYKGAMSSIFSELIRQNRLLILDQFFIEQPKTKFLLYKLKQINLKSYLILIDKIDKNLVLSAQNLNNVEVLPLSKLNPISLISSKTVITTPDTLKKIETILL